MDQDFHIDVDEVRRAIESADVVALFFPYFRKTLLLDFRGSRLDPPMARVVPMVRSAEERMRALRRLRPRLGRPEAITLIAWPRFVASVKTSGVWHAAADRLQSAGEPHAAVTLERCYRELLAEERAELLRAVTGQGYRSLWERGSLPGT